MNVHVVSALEDQHRGLQQSSLRSRGVLEPEDKEELDGRLRYEHSEP